MRSCYILAIASGVSVGIVYQCMRYYNTEPQPLRSVHEITSPRAYERALGPALIKHVGSHSYTLVEFADFECGPCARVSGDVAMLVRRHSPRLEFRFRNYPLSRIHPHAFDKALVAEAARIQGRSTEANRALFALRSNWNDDKGRELASGLGLDLRGFRRDLATAATRAVERDISDGTYLGVQGTPTFLVCTPVGRVFQLRSLSDVEPLLKGGG